MKSSDYTPEYWLDQIETAKKSESDWRKRAEKVQNLYDMENEADAQSFNVLWANTQTLLPSLYSDTPKPEIRNRWYADKPLAKAVSMVLERGIEYSIDFLNFDRMATETVLDYLVPGRATIRVRYRPFFGPGDPVRYEVEQGGDGKLRANGAEITDDSEIQGDESGFYVERPGEDRVVYQEVFPEHVYWEDFLHGAAKKWNRVPWVAFGHDLTKDEVADQFGRSKAEKIPYENGETEDEEPTARCWEIWCKRTRKAYVVSEGDKTLFLDKENDPLGLQEFFPCPEPAYAVPRSGSLIPKPEYTMYQHLADEVNDLTNRITSVANAIRGRGAYPKEMGELLGLLSDADDGELIPVENWTQWMEKGGLSGVVDWLPVEEMAKALVVLVRERNNSLQTIYEITGISDILRGSTDPRETAKAQGLKAQFGTRRLRLKQRDIQRMFRDVYRLMAEIMAEHFDAQTFTLISGVPVTKQHTELMSNDVLRTFAIDIETDSTIAADEAQDKRDSQEAMTVFAQIGAGAQQLAEQLGPDVVKAMVLAAMKPYKFFSREIEDLVRNAQPPPKEPTFAERLEAQDQQRRVDEGRKREASRASETQGKNALAQATALAKTAEATERMSNTLDDNETNDNNSAD